MEFNPLIPVGTSIKFDKSKIRTVLTEKSWDNLPKIINGEVRDYKMTDGMDIGYVIITQNNLKIWIFNNEINEQTKKEYKIEDHNTFTNQITKDNTFGKYKLNYDINGNRNIKMIINPVNLISWLIFTLKDIV